MATPNLYVPYWLISCASVRTLVFLGTSTSVFQWIGPVLVARRRGIGSYDQEEPAVSYR